MIVYVRDLFTTVYDIIADMFINVVTVCEYLTDGKNEKSMLATIIFNFMIILINYSN